jgi:hypothetical protein
MFMFMVIDKDIGIHTWFRFVPKIIESETKRSSSIKKMSKTKKRSVWVKIRKRNETKGFDSNNSETKKKVQFE